MLTSCCY